MMKRFIEQSGFLFNYCAVSTNLVHNSSMLYSIPQKIKIPNFFIINLRIKGSEQLNGIKITIKQIEGVEGEYIAFYKSEFLKATYGVFFTDSIYGSVSLLDFAEMLKFKYDEKKVSFEISNEKITFQSPELLDVMMNRRRA